MVFLHIEEMNSGGNSGIHVGLPTTLSELQIKLPFAGTASAPDQFSTGSLIYNPAILGQQPAPLRGSGSDSCPDLRHLPCSLPKRQGPHPLESPSVHVRFGYEKKQYGKTHMAPSPRIVPSPCSHSGCSLCLILWTNLGRRGFGVSEGR